MVNNRNKRLRVRNRRKKIKKLKSIRFSLVTLLFLIGGMFFLTTLIGKQPQVETRERTEEISKEEFVDFLAPYAVELYREYGVLPSIILGQAILESDWGQSELSQNPNNNLFGMKASGKQKKIHMKTKEFVNGVWIEDEADFRVYPDWESSLRDHTMLFVNGVSWNPDLYKKVLTADSYKEAAKALQEAGYATDPTYTEKIIDVIESHKLYEYDTGIVVKK